MSMAMYVGHGQPEDESSFELSSSSSSAIEQLAVRRKTNHTDVAVARNPRSSSPAAIVVHRRALTSSPSRNDRPSTIKVQPLRARPKAEGIQSSPFVQYDDRRRREADDSARRQEDDERLRRRATEVEHEINARTMAQAMRAASTLAQEVGVAATALQEKEREISAGRNQVEREYKMKMDELQRTHEAMQASVMEKARQEQERIQAMENEMKKMREYMER